jgi:hypothetical protein
VRGGRTVGVPYARTSAGRQGTQAPKPSGQQGAIGIKPAETTSLKQSGETKAGTALDEKQIFGGRSYDAWRAELSRYEFELVRLEQKLDMLRERLSKPSDSVADGARMKQEYNELRGAYDQKYAEYSRFVDSASKAGVVIK